MPQKLHILEKSLRLTCLLLTVFVLFAKNGTSQCTANAGPDTSICLNAAAQLGGLPAGTGLGTLTYSWSPTAGLSNPNIANPVVTATTNQTYTLTVTSSPDGCTASDQVNVTIDALPTAGFNIVGNNNCSNIPVSFTNTSSGTGLTYSWNFGDPTSGGQNTSTLPNPTHSFVTNGTGSQTYNVTLAVTNSSGCSASITQTVTIRRVPNPTLIDPIADMKNCSGTNFAMTVYDGSATTAVTSYTIQWGDGSPDYNSATFPGAGVNHTYTTAEVFTLNYIIVGNNGCADTTTYNIANITNPAIGAANPGATTGCGPLTLCFPLNNYASNHSTTYYVVNYGDGSPLDTLPHPPPATVCHTYTGSSCGQAGNAFTFRIKAVNLCDSSTASISPIRVYTGPQANFNPAAVNNCVNSPVTFINTSVTGFNSSCSASTLFQWNFGDGGTLTTATLTNPTHTYTAPGTYTVTLTTSNNCGSTVITKVVCIEVPPVPSFTLSPNTGCIPFVTQTTDASTLLNTCSVNRVWSVIFNGSTCLPSAGTYSFVGGTNASSVNPQIQFNAPGMYTVRLSLTNSCGTFIFDQVVTAQTVPQVSVNPITSICANTTASPTAVINSCYEPTDTYAWTFTGGTPSTSSSLNPGAVTFPSSGTFPITLAAANQCGTTSGTTNIVVNPIPPLLNPNVNSPLCVGQTANFTSDASAGTVYHWSGPNSYTNSNQNFSIPGVTAANAGTYTLYGTINGCVGPSASVNLIVDPIPVVNVTPTNPAICNGSYVVLTATGATSYSWTPGTGLSAMNTDIVTANPTSTQTYTVTGTAGTCSGTTTVTVIVNPLPIVNAGPDTTVCNQPVSFQVPATPVGGTWSGPNITAGGSFTPSGAGSFTVTYTFTDINGCTNSDSRVVTVIAATPANAGSDLISCLNAPTLTLNGTPGGGTWTGTNVTSGGVFTPATVGTFNLVYHFGSGTCATTDTMQMIVNPLPVVDAGVNFSRCIDATAVTLNGTPAGGTWSGTGITNPPTGGTFTPATAGAGSFTLTYAYTDPITGCSNTDPLTAVVTPLPIVNAGPDSTACNQPTPFTLSCSPAGGTWSGPNVSATGIFTPSGTGTFTVTYTFTDGNGCTNSDTRVVTINNPIQPNAGNDFAVCIDAANVALNGSPAGGTWTGTNVTSGGVFDPTTAGTFSLVYSYGGGNCLLTDTLLVTVNPLPIVDAGANFSRCIDAPAVTLNGTPAGGTWTGTGITNPSGTFTPATAGAGTFILTYTYTDANSCSASDVLTATVNPLPVVNAGADTTLCNQPFPVQFTGTPASGTWSGPNITATGVFTPAGTGTFTVTYTFTNANGCTNSDTRLVTVNNPIQPNAGNDFSVCIDAANVTLNGTPVGGTWTGTNVTSGGIFDPTTAGNFSLVYSYGAGNCLLRDTLVVTVNPLPVVDAGMNFAVCIDASAVTLNGTPAGGTWTGTGITNPTGTFTPATAGAGSFTLTYTYTDANSCTANDVLTATVNPLPVVNAGIDTTLCNQPFPVQFTGTPTGGTWSGPNITASGVFTPSGTGNATVTYSITNGTGCTGSDSRIVTVVNPVPSNAGADLEACHNDANVQLNGTPVSGTWTGTNVTSGGLFSPSTVGTFTLVLSNGAGNCLMRDTMLFTVHPLPIVTVGADQHFCPSDAAVNFTGNPVGGAWTGNGITSATNGTFDPAVAPVGTNTIVYTYTEPLHSCVNRDTLLVIVHPFPTANFNYNPIICAGTAETFTNTSTLGNTYSWDFGDGGTSATLNGIHTYTGAGFFDVELLVTSAFGCLDSITHQIEVRIPPTADFTLAPDSACGPLTVNFTDLSSGPSLNYSWNFGNGQTSAVASPGAQVYNAGILADTVYTVVLSLTNFCGTDTHSETVTVMPNPLAIFGTATDIGCSPLILDIINNSVGLPDTYAWDFGDGTTSSTSAGSLQHTFTTGTSDTTYVIQLIVTNECGSDTLTHPITVLPNQVTAFFNVDDPDGCAPHTVNFTQFSQGSTFSEWDFGDGNGATTYNATHTFTQPGTYTVSLYANDGCGYDTTTAVITVFPSPLVDFSSQPDSVCINLDFTFTNLSTNVASVSWDFGDGQASNLFNPTHSYTSSGTYFVTLSGVSQTNGCVGSITKPIVVSMNPIAAFNPSPINGCVPLTVDMNNQSTNGSFQTWNFGDGNGSTQFSPTHTYTSSGSFTIQLYVENANGCSDSLEQIITVYPLPTAAFTVATTDPCVQPTVATFTNNSTGAQGYEWDFGDGGTSTLTNPTHSYTTPGDYTVSLIASTMYGCTDTATFDVHSYELSVAGFTLPDDSVCVGDPVIFQSNSQFADSVLWDFGDGTLISGTTVEYAFTGSGVYPITLYAYGAGGCNDTVTLNTPITIMPTPVAGFTYVNEQAPDPLSGTVVFTNTSIDAESYYWEFGNGNSSDEANPLEQYHSYGDFDVMLMASTDFGCADTIYETIYVDFFYGLFIPNAISPGHSSFEVANFIPKGVGLKTFELLIYDDWGNLIWSTNALDADGRPTEYWDGTFQGVPVQQDSYVWKATATFMNEKVWEGKEYDNNRIKRAGTVTVIR